MRKIFRKNLLPIVLLLSLIFQSNYIFALANNNYDLLDENIDIIYLNTETGNDSNTGESPDYAVKTFEKAKELATVNQNVKVIDLYGSIKPENGDFTLEGTNAILKRNASYTGNMLYIGNKDITLKNIIIDGNSEQVEASKSLISLYDNSNLKITEGAILQNNKIKTPDSSVFDATGGAINASNSVIYIEDGSIIRENTASYGGGIFLNTSTLFMDGGTIENNHVVNAKNANATGRGQASGGGIATYASQSIRYRETEIYLSGGIIKNNTSEVMGGGISLGYESAPFTPAVLNMTGGTIEGNSAKSSGGGIFIQAHLISNRGIENVPEKFKTGNIANISGGKIINNKMTGDGIGNNGFGGGGIYINGYKEGLIENWTPYNGVLNLKNASIFNNRSYMEGAGYAGCPISVTSFYLKDGIALYSNQSENNKANDLYILASNEFGAHSGNPEYTIANSMLGGQAYNWKDNEGNFVALNKLKGVLDASISEELALTAGNSGDFETKSKTKVEISGNYSATRGGGVGSNGEVNFGTDDTTEITGKKIWDDENNKFNLRPQSITLELYRKDLIDEDEKYIGYIIVKPNENNDWNFVFNNLPKLNSKGEEYIYNVKEKTVENYDTNINYDKTEGFTIINKINVNNINILGSKTWNDNNNKHEKRPESINIRLFANNKEIASKKVSEDDGWSWKFESLEKYDKEGKEIIYTIKEDNVKDYKAEVNGYNVINTYVSEEKETPIEPEPEKNETPKETQRETEKEKPNKPRNNTKRNKGSNPKTGDDFNYLLYAGIICLSLTGLMIINKKKIIKRK